jgi:hypothetical protein
LGARDRFDRPCRPVVAVSHYDLRRIHLSSVWLLNARQLFHSQDNFSSARIGKKEESGNVYMQVYTLDVPRTASHRGLFSAVRDDFQ